KKFNEAYFHALSLGPIAPKFNTQASAEWLLNGKGVAYQSLAEQILLTRDARDPATKQLAGDLRGTRARLAALVNRLPKPGLEAQYQTALKSLLAREQDLAQKLARAVGRPYRAISWITLDELRAKLGPKTAFVDIARFPVWDFAAHKSMGPRYVAWITPPQGKGDVQLIDLGEAEPIDRLVAAARQTPIATAQPVKKGGEPDQ